MAITETMNCLTCIHLVSICIHWRNLYFLLVIFLISKTDVHAIIHGLIILTTAVSPGTVLALMAPASTGTMIQQDYGCGALQLINGMLPVLIYLQQERVFVSVLLCRAMPGIPPKALPSMISMCLIRPL